MTKSPWRQRADEVIAEFCAANPDASGDELKKLLRPHYPFGERKNHPYKIWLSAVNEVCASPYKPATQTSLSDKVHIFSNGSEFDHWECRNCDICKHSSKNNGQSFEEMPTCRIEHALVMAKSDDGTVTKEVKDQIFHTEGYICEHRILLTDNKNVSKSPEIAVENIREYWTSEQS